MSGNQIKPILELLTANGFRMYSNNQALIRFCKTVETPQGLFDYNLAVHTVPSAASLPERHLVACVFTGPGYNKNKNLLGKTKVLAEWKTVKGVLNGVLPLIGRGRG